MDELAPRTFFTLDRLEDEAEEMEDAQDQDASPKSQGMSTIG